MALRAGLSVGDSRRGHSVGEGLDDEDRCCFHPKGEGLDDEPYCLTPTGELGGNGKR